MPKATFLLTLLLLIMHSTAAQYKIGTVNTSVVFNKMIEAENLNAILNKYQDSLYQIGLQREKEFDERMSAWIRNCDDCPPLPDSIRKKIRKQFIEQTMAVRNFYDQIPVLCKNKSKQLLQSLKYQLKEVAQQVVATGNYYYVLDISDEHLSFLPLPPVDDITDQVLCKLNL